MAQNNQVAAAYARRDAVWTAGWLTARVGAAVISLWVLSQWDKIHLSRAVEGWPDDSWWMWWKNRLSEAGYMQPGGDMSPAVHLTVTLHTGGTWYSTPEEMARLWFPDLESGGDSTATPGIERTLTKPQPVDATAARVTNFRDE